MRLAAGEHRVCTVCGELKLLTDFNFRKGKVYRSECRVCQNAYCKKHYDENLKHDKNKRKGKMLKHYFGMSLDDFNRMVKDQKGKCKVCGDDLVLGKATHVDHDHKTGKVRGILCKSCDNGLGWYEKLGPKFKIYLEQSAKQTKKR